MKTLCEKPRVRRLLDHFSAVTDRREQWRVAYPLPEVLLLVVCGTIASCDDYDDIVDWGEAHLAFLRRFLPYFHGIPCADWLRMLMNRVDPEVFSTCFMRWVHETWPDAPKLVKRPEIGKLIDDAMEAIEKAPSNEGLKGVLPKNYARPTLNKTMLGELIDLFSKSGCTTAPTGRKTCWAGSMNISCRPSPVLRASAGASSSRPAPLSAPW